MEAIDHPVWKAARIYGAVKSSVYGVQMDQNLIFGLVERTLKNVDRCELDPPEVASLKDLTQPSSKTMNMYRYKPDEMDKDDIA
ncbi:hypothetical protein H5410_004472 [Solanum commersonii]|uniref:Uncharacterized protein n=1 Tax=Solanum commersonii TaxID=4109 RepID=A0A9J6B827_SOLCO|nr:hypothetical protein H5410_004472 [Solanum commersonii]